MEFFFGFPRGYGLTNGKLHVYVYTPSPASVDVAVPLTGVFVSRFVSNSTEILFDHKFRLPDSTGKYPYGFHIESSQTIEVYIEDVQDASTEGTVLIPEKKLSKHYVILTWHDPSLSQHSYASEIMVVGTVNNTIITIELNNGKTWTETLDRYEIYQYQAYHDVSGSYISATKNVAVFAGHECTDVLANSCDRLLEQMPPTANLQSEYIISFPYPRLLYVVRIAAVVNNTNVALSNGTETTLNRGDIAEYVFNNTPVSVASSNKVLVSAYSTGSTIKPGGLPEMFDPSMIILPGISQFKSYYGFFVPNNVKRSVLMITYPSYASASQNLRLNSEQVVVTATTEVIVSGRGNYSILYVDVNPGENDIYSTDETIFGAYLSLFRRYSETWFSLSYKFV